MDEGMPTPRAADVLLADGRIAQIRPLESGDRDGLLALHEEAGEVSVRMRFFSLNRRAAHDYAEHLLQSPDDTVVTLVAVLEDRIAAVGTAERVAATAAEVAFLVSDRQHGQGLGSLLLEHLAAAGRDRGIRRFVAEVLMENAGMMRVFRSAGFEVSRTTEQGVVSVEMSTEATTRAVEAADLRESVAEARSLRPLLSPRTVAVVGVRRAGGGLGRAVLRSITGGGFTGTTYVVHPTTDDVDGVSAHPSLASIPEHVDLAVVAVPAVRVLDVIKDAAAAGVSSVVVISSGFGEMGADGTAVQSQMVRIARDHNMRLVGPNCLGVMANAPDVGLNATFSRSVPPSGGLAVASQSGGVGIALLDVAADLDLGVHAFVSLGNKADVSGNDLLAAWIDDAQVTAAALYLESFGNVPKFARMARRFAERKPVLAVVGGRSAGGKRAGASHTAAAASPAVGVDALFAQAGVIGCRSAEEMGRSALLLSGQPLPPGPRVAIVSNAGGLGVLAADAADVEGLVVPEVPGELRARLATYIPGTAGTSNPVDLGADASPENLAGVIDPLLASDQIDVLLVVLVMTSVSEPEPLLEAVTSGRSGHPDKPVVLVGLGDLGDLGAELTGVTRYRSVDHAVEAIGHAVRYGAWRRTPRVDPQPSDPVRAQQARAVAGEALSTGTTSGWLDTAAVTRLGGPYGIVPLGAVVDSPQRASEEAEQMGFPVAMKVADPEVVHKTDRGLVRVGLRSAAEVLTTAQAFEREVGREGVPVLVQPVLDGVEVALGVARDPKFGPQVMVAAGGVATNVLDDRAFLLAPFARQDAARAIRSLRIWPLLDGYRGAEPVDVGSLEQLLVSLGDLAADVPEIAEVDLNPVMATPGGTVLVDVKVRLSPASPLDAGIPRQLRAAT